MKTLLFLLLLPLAASAQTLKWKPTQGTICFYSTTNLVFTPKDRQDTLVRLMNQFNYDITKWPANIRMNIDDLIVIQSRHLPPLRDWQPYTKVPATSGLLKINKDAKQRFFIATIMDSTGKFESDPSR